MVFILQIQECIRRQKKNKKIFYDEMLEMSSLGSKVMQPTSVQDAKLNKIDITVKSSFVKKNGTLITGVKNHLVIR